MNPLVLYILFGGLIAWRMYRRIRRNIGRQKLQPRRSIVRLIPLGLFSVFVIFAGVQNPSLLVGYGAGLLGGVILGFVGLKLTQFETTNDGHFYTPDTRIGLALSLLLAGRLLYRISSMNPAALSVAPAHPPPAQSPLTYFILGLTIGYSIVYYIGLFVHSRSKAPATATASVSQSSSASS